MGVFNKTSRGLPQLILTITIAWALVAVLLLTGTLINAREIDRRVIYINSQLSPINAHTADIALAGKTATISHNILTAAAPLSAGFTKINNSVIDINNKVQKILSTARAINGKVVTIGSTVAPIHGTVISIHNAVSGSITPTLGTVGTDVGSIGTTVRSIDSAARSILGTAKEIRPQATLIDTNVDKIIAPVAGNPNNILSDFNAIDALVGNSGGVGGSTTINAHANSIDCAGLFQLAGATRGCNK